MKYNLELASEKRRYDNKSDFFKSKGKTVDLKEVKQTRSIKQNSYLHICITLYAIEFGYTLAESKTYLKRTCGFMVYEKNNSPFLKETKKMDSKELTEFIEWIRNYASQNGLYIPTSEEYKTNKYSIDNEIEKFKTYL